MENLNIDESSLSHLYPQLDTLTPEEKQQVIDYLTKSVATDTTMQKEVDQKSVDLLGTISESHEHRENITANDICVYIHGNPMGHQTSGEIEDRRQDPLLQQGYFGRYYTYRVEKTQVFAKNLGNGSIEYTIQQPSLEVGHRSGGYFGFTFILKNGFKIKDTGDIPEGHYQRNYAPNDPVWSVMKSFMDQVLIKDVGLATVQQGDLLKRQTNDKSFIQQVVLHLKSNFISAMNDIEENNGFLIKE